MTTPATDRTVRISAQYAAGSGLQVQFGRSLFLAQDTSTPTTAAAIALQRSTQGTSVFADAAAVNAVYPAGHSARDAASIYFQQSPPPRNLVIGTQIAAAQLGYVFGTGLPADIADVVALGNSVALTLGSADVTIDLSGAVDNDAVAATLQTALRAVVAFGATTVVSAAGDRLTVSVPTAAPIGTGFADSPAARTLGLFGPGVNVFGGIAAETPTAALDRIQVVDDTWYYAALDTGIYDTSAVVDIANWAAARTKILALDSTQSLALTPNETTSFLAQVSALEQSRVFGFWSAYADHKALSLSARMGSVNYARPQAVTTAKFRQLPGTTPDVLTPAQLDELTRKRVNFYTDQHGVNIVAEGTSFDGWIDERVGLDWLVSDMLSALFTELVQARRVPQTSAGLASLISVARGRCAAAVQNGLVAPGQVSPTLAEEIRTAISNPDFDGFLTTGYLVYAPPIASQSQAERNSRVSPPISVWIKGAGAIHRVEVAIIFQG